MNMGSDWKAAGSSNVLLARPMWHSSLTNATATPQPSSQLIAMPNSFASPEAGFTVRSRR